MIHDKTQEIDFSFYDAFSIQELEDILRKDVAGENETPLDLPTLFYLTERLTKLKKDEGIDSGISAKESWQNFKNNYLVDLEPERKRIQWSKNWKRILTAAAMLAITCTVSLYAIAGDHNPFPGVIQWTKDTFSYSTSNDPPPPPDTVGRYHVESEAELFDNLGIPKLFIPVWLPAGYIFSDSEVYETPSKIDALIFYRNGEQELRYSICSKIDTYQENMEQSEETFYEVYFSDNVPFYIFSNYDQIQATWQSNQWEYYFSGNISKEELIQIIDSMEKG